MALDIESQRFLHGHEGVRTAAQYSGLLKYARQRLSAPMYDLLIGQMGAVGLPLDPNELVSCEDGLGVRRTRALNDLIYGLMLRVGTDTVAALPHTWGGSSSTSAGSLTAKSVDAPGAAAVSSGSADVVWGSANVGGNVIAGDTGNAMRVITPNLNVGGTPAGPKGSATFLGGVSTRGVLFYEKQKLAEMLGASGQFFEDYQGDLAYTKQNAPSRADRWANLYGPTFDTGWVGVVSHLLIDRDPTAAVLATLTYPLRDVRLDRTEPGEPGSVVDAQLWMKSLVVSPDGIFSSPPYTLPLSGEPGSPWYGAVIALSNASGTGGETWGVGLALAENGEMHIVLGSQGLVVNRIFWVYAQVRVQLWLRGAA